MARPKGNQEQTAVRKFEILEAAYQFFSKNGYNNTSLADIGAACGVTASAIVHHFNSKAELLEAVLELRDKNRIQGDLANLSGLPIQFFAAWLSLVEISETEPGLVELFSHLSAEATNSDHPAHDYFSNRYQRVVAMTTHAFESAANNGLLASSAAPEKLAVAMIALVNGAQQAWLYDKTQLIEDALNLFLASIFTEAAHQKITGSMQ